MPIKYIPYTPDPIKGQALLDNISRSQRVLRYRDNGQVFKKILRGMPYYEVEMIEQADKPGKDWNNLLLRGECLSACAYLKEQGIKVDLVYVDPPFASGANYAKKVYIRRDPYLAEKIAQAEQEMEMEELQTFEETMYGDIWQKEDYLNWMYENLMAIKSVMSGTASIYVHLDWHIGHYVKVLMDEVFGEENFINEIVWLRSTSGKTVLDQFSKDTDTIFLYSISENYVFNSTYKPLSESSISMYNKDDNDGRGKYRLYPLQKTASPGPETTYDYIDNNGQTWKCPPKGWRMNKNKLKKLEDDNRLYLAGKTLSEKAYWEERKNEGRLANNLWDDIYNLQGANAEITGYSTQKPEALLERIIKASSDEGMVVADFFGGSGVTAKVAHDLDRRFIHCDIGLNSLQTTRDRLQETKASFQVMEIKDGVSLFRNPQQTMDKLAKLIPGLQRQVEGIGNFWFGAIQDSKLGSIPVYVPDLIDSSEKVLDIPIINRIINEELQKLDTTPEKVIAYFVDIDDRRELEQFIRDNNRVMTKIELRDLKILLAHTVSNDEFNFTSSQDKNEFLTRITKFHSDRLQQKITEFNDKRQLKAANRDEIKPVLISDEGLELIEWLAVDCKSATGAWHSSNEIKIDKLGYTTIDGKKTKRFWNGAITSKQKPLRIKVRNIAGDETIKAVDG